MKKILITVLLTLSLIGCGCSKIEETAEILNTKRMTCVESTVAYAVYVDSETGVMYFCRGTGGLCVMVDIEGNPLIYQHKEK